MRSSSPPAAGHCHCESRPPSPASLGIQASPASQVTAWAAGQAQLHVVWQPGSMRPGSCVTQDTRVAAEHAQPVVVEIHRTAQPAPCDSGHVSTELEPVVAAGGGPGGWGDPRHHFFAPSAASAAATAVVGGGGGYTLVLPPPWGRCVEDAPWCFHLPTLHLGTPSRLAWGLTVQRDSSSYVGMNAVRAF